MKLGRAALLILLTHSVLWGPPAAETQQAGKVHRVGYLSQSSMSAAPPAIDPAK